MEWTLTLGGTAYRGRPLSAEAVWRTQQELFQAGKDEAAGTAALERLMRLAFPLRWRYLWVGDPVRKFLRHPGRNALLVGFLKIPPEKVEPVREPDEWDRLEAMQRVEDDPGSPKVTLAMVCRLTEAAMGAGWYWNPGRWPTWDGYAPYDVVWRAWTTMQQARAFERLNMVRAIGITRAGEKAQAIYDSDVREALGG
jgi:hypothetical protein